MQAVSFHLLVSSNTSFPSARCTRRGACAACTHSNRQAARLFSIQTSLHACGICTYWFIEIIYDSCHSMVSLGSLGSLAALMLMQLG